MKKTVHKLLLETPKYSAQEEISVPVSKLKIKENLITNMTWCIMESALVSYVIKII